MHPNRGHYGKKLSSLRFLHFCQSVAFLIKMGELPDKCNVCILVSEDSSSTMVNHHDEVHTTEESSQHNTEDLNEEDEDEFDDKAPYPIGIMGLFFFLLLFSYLLIFFYKWFFSKNV